MVSPRTRRIAARAVTALTVTALLALAGCGEPQSTPQVMPTTPQVVTSPTEAASPTPTVSTPPPVDREIVVTVAGRKVTPPPGRVQVAKGSTVRITVTSDVKDELHVHGYDLKVALPAGTPASVDFRADKDGLFEVETHETKLVLFQLLVR